MRNGRAPARVAAECALLALGVYALSVAAGLVALQRDGPGLPLYPGVGLGLAVLVLRGLDLWPGVLLGSGVLLLHLHLTLAHVLAFAAVQTVGSVAGAWLIRRIPGFDSRLESLRDAAGWVGGLLATAALQAIARALLFRSANAPWVIWLLASAAGSLVVGTALLAWTRPRRPLHQQGLARNLEFAALLGASAFTFALAFGSFGVVRQSSSTTFVIIPFLFWGALRFGLRGATSVVLLLTAAAMSGTSVPAEEGAAFEHVLLLQALLVTSSCTGLLFAAAAAERAKAAVEVQHALARYQALVEGLPDVLLRVSGGGRVLDLVARQGPLAGRSDELLGRDVREVLPGGDVIHSAIAQALDERRPVQCNLQVSGREVECTVSIAGADEAIVLARDVTETRKLQAQLLLSDRLAAVGTLAAGVAHEINNPLAFMSANLEVLPRLLEKLTPENADEVRREVAELASETASGAQRIARIVRDLRVFSQSSADTHGTVDLRSVLDDCASVASNEIRHRARLTKKYDPVPLLIGNAATLGQVFLNLIVNAAQAIPEGAAERNEVRLSLRDDPARGGAVVEVRDTGVGIAPENLPRIFDPFFSTKPVGIGTGLGLSVCHRIVTAAGGEIEVQSTPGRGTLVRVFLPYEPPVREPGAPLPDSFRTGPLRTTPMSTPPDQTPVNAPEVAQRTRKRVLVIDDEPLVGRSVGRLLAPELDVAVVSSVQEAREKLANDGAWDAVLCDLMMPDETGMDLHAWLASHNPALLPRIVFMTGGAFTSGASEFLRGVQNPRLEKPFSPASLLQTLRAVMA